MPCRCFGPPASLVSSPPGMPAVPHRVLMVVQGLTRFSVSPDTRAAVSAGTAFDCTSRRRMQHAPRAMQRAQHPRRPRRHQHHLQMETQARRAKKAFDRWVDRCATLPPPPPVGEADECLAPATGQGQSALAATAHATVPRGRPSRLLPAPPRCAHAAHPAAPSAPPAAPPRMAQLHGPAHAAVRPYRGQYPGVDAGARGGVGEGVEFRGYRTHERGRVCARAQRWGAAGATQHARCRQRAAALGTSRPHAAHPAPYHRRARSGVPRPLLAVAAAGGGHSQPRMGVSAGGDDFIVPRGGHAFGPGEVGRGCSFTLGRPRGLGEAGAGLSPAAPGAGRRTGIPRCTAPQAGCTPWTDAQTRARPGTRAPTSPLHSYVGTRALYAALALSGLVRRSAAPPARRGP